MQIAFPVLSLIVFLPLAGAVILLFFRNRTAVNMAALVTSIITFALTIYSTMCFDPSQTGFQLEEYLPWIQAWGISYHLGIDGLSLFLLPLTGFLSVLAVLISWKKIVIREKAYYFSFLFLECGMLGVFVALDTILFYIFWEAMLIPMFLIIGIWGGANRRYAAIKFLIYTMAGSIFMLIAIIAMAVYAGAYGSVISFDITVWLSMPIPANIQYWLFAAFFIAFAIKVPVFPFHTWLPDAHVEAPTAGSVLLAGVLLKMGVYGILRFCFPLFPDAVNYFTDAILLLGLIGIIYGAFVAFAQTDLKKLVAYSSVCHMGLIVVGIFALNHAGIKGGILQMVNHGLSTGALFILVGALYERTGTRNMEVMGGLAKKLPVLAAFFMIVTLSSIGLPGLNGFIGEFFLLLAAFKYKWWLGALAATTMILGAIYMLWMYQRVMFEKSRVTTPKVFSDFSARENMVMVPVILLLFFIGLYPSYFLDRLTGISDAVLAGINKTAITQNVQR